MRDFMTTTGAPSVSVAVARDGKLVFEDARGLADLENSVPATTSSMYRLASVTKPMTAVAVLQLAASGKLSLDDRVQKYVPAFADAHGAVTIRDLLRHTGGIRHYKAGEFAATRHCNQLAEGLPVFASDPMANAPGEFITYSSYGYVLLGLAIERASGATFADYLHSNVFVPARMQRTKPDDVHAIVPHRVAGYTKRSDGSLRRADLVDTSCRMPAGGLLATASDVARFGIALLDGKLLAETSRAQMMTSQVPEETVRRTLDHLKAPPGYKPAGMGFGWSIGTERHPDAVLHGGNQQGATAMLFLVPKRRLVIAILSNLEAQGSAITLLAERIASLAE
jgi:serine beta-lactamase-like protein LACTB